MIDWLRGILFDRRVQPAPIVLRERRVRVAAKEADKRVQDALARLECALSSEHRKKD